MIALAIHAAGEIVDHLALLSATHAHSLALLSATPVLQSVTHVNLLHLASQDARLIHLTATHNKIAHLAIHNQIAHLSAHLNAHLHAHQHAHQHALQHVLHVAHKV